MVMDVLQKNPCSTITKPLLKCQNDFLSFFLNEWNKILLLGIQSFMHCKKTNAINTLTHSGGNQSYQTFFSLFSDFHS